ncbi:MAG: DNA primase [Bacteroidota bacterium]|nr:DNA primase [Bacteroidota bacterium]
MRIPTEKIEEIRNATDIVDLIGSFIPLKKRGKNYVGLCPFHTEKTPSFNVSPERQMYHCFGCGTGGNAITFLMEYEKVSFVEAVRSLADKAGISIPKSSQDQEDIASEQEQLYELTREAGLFYYNYLNETTEGKFALEYFHHRGFSDEIIRTFGLGYSPNSWKALIDFAAEKNLSIELLEKAGLVRKRDDGSYHDYFRGRAMFPIFSTTGRVIGFGARKLYEDDPLGKYINSPETIIYNKSKILYGIYNAKEAIREKDSVILVEGYADLISVYQVGIRNVVASSGTALTQEQIQLINRYTKKIIIVYDADSAGSKAALRGVDLILENDLDVSVVSLPEGEDPDSFVRSKGGKALEGLVENSISFIDFIAQSYEREGKLQTPEGQAQTVRAIVQTIAKMKDELKRNFYIRQVAEKYRLYESTLVRELEKIIGGSRRTIREQNTHLIPIAADDIIQNQKHTKQEIPNGERDLLHAILEGGVEVLKLIIDSITPEDFTHPLTKTLFIRLLNYFEEGKPIDHSVLIDNTNDLEQQRLIAEIAFSKYQLSKGWDESGIQIERADPKEIAIDALNMIRRKILERLTAENQRQLQEASQCGEDVLPYLERHRRFIQELMELKTKIIK